MKLGIEVVQPKSYLTIEVVKPTLWGRIRGSLPVIRDFIVLWFLLTGLILALKS